MLEAINGGGAEGPEFRDGVQLGPEVMGGGFAAAAAVEDWVVIGDDCTPTHLLLSVFW